MCSGTESSKQKPSPPGFPMKADVQEQRIDPCRCSSLLEFSASDDIDSFKKVVEAEGISALEREEMWYGRRIGTRRMGCESRTPLLIAASYGSLEILKWMLSMDNVDVNRSCGSDGATALHCAVAGGASSLLEVVRLLLDACASLESVDASGNRAVDLLSLVSVLPQSKKKALEQMLRKDGGGDGAEKEDMSSFSPESQAQLSDQRSSEGKKEYPVDLSLPDIKNGIYSTDEFRMYAFKVKPCSRAYSHDWTECPFVHPGENARRRDPRKYLYSCVPCPEFRKGSCRNGDACEYAHGVFECWLHPAQYRTRLCKDETGCTRRVCFFAHKREELRPLHPSTGSAILSPRSVSSTSSSSSSSFDVGGMSPLSVGSPSAGPLSPMSLGMGGIAWQNQALQPPALQLPSSRLRSTLSARDLQHEMDLVGMEMDELAAISARNDPLSAALAAISGCRSGKFSHLGSNATAAPNLDELLASLDSSTLSQLQNLSLKSTSQVLPNLTSGFSSPMRSDLQGAFSSMTDMQSALSSQMRAASSASLGLDPSLPLSAAMINSREAAFAKRSQSFSERALMNRYAGGLSSAAATVASIGSTSAMLSDWGSPNGKLDWGVQREELHKMRKSASFAIRNNGNAVPAGSMGAAGSMDEPDVSWVHSLVKEGPAAGWPGSEHQQYQLGTRSGDAGPEMLPAWAELSYLDQEQTVA